MLSNGDVGVGLAPVSHLSDQRIGELRAPHLGALHFALEQRARELIDLVKQSKGSIQAPKSVDFADEIPLSPLGKADKKALRTRYWQDTDRQVH